MKQEFLHLLNIFKHNIALLLSIIFTFLSPVYGMLIVTGGFVLTDTLFAIYSAVSVRGWKAYKSHNLFNIAPKLFFYFGAIILGFLIDTYLLEGKLMGIELLISKFVCFFLCYIEIKSIDETSIKIGNRSLWVILKEIIKKAREIKKDISDLNQ